MEFKNFFKNKNSEVSFNQEDQSFVIEDNAKTQIWFLRILMVFNFLFMTAYFIRSEDPSYLFLISGVFFLIVFVLSFLISSVAQLVPLDQIKHLVYRRNNNTATLGIKMKNNRYRNLYIYQVEGAEEIVILFREQNIIIKEKKFLFS